MTAITLRNIPLRLEELIRERADRDGLSLDGVVLRMLEEAAGERARSTDQQAKDDLDALSGSWTREEAAEFDAVLAEQRRIDPDLWR